VCFGRFGWRPLGRRQGIDALALQRLDLLLSMEAGAMGLSKDTLMRELFFASLFTPNDM
jgi:hypothetical protein